MANASRERSKLRRFSSRAIALSAFAYLVAIAALTIVLYVEGEHWWVTTALLYLPRVAFLIPLLFLSGALLLTRQRRLLWTQGAALLIVWFPLMGFALPWPVSSGDGASFRLLSMNVDSAYAGTANIVAQIVAANPDIALIQEGQAGGGELSEALRAHYPYVEASTQFAVASRFPILASTDPDRLPYYGRQRSPRFMRYLIASPIGRIALYNVHPISPRGALHVSRFRDALHQLRTGEFLNGDPEADLGGNSGLRALQIAAVAQLAAKESDPVLISGDTNLPGLSVILRDNLSRYTDAFRSASWGFGYTFPTKHPFLRLDRMLSGPEIRFSSFRTGCPGVSDHLCIVADVERTH